MELFLIYTLGFYVTLLKAHDKGALQDAPSRVSLLCLLWPVTVPTVSVAMCVCSILEARKEGR